MTLLLFAGFVALILLRVPITMAIGLAVLIGLALTVLLIPWGSIGYVL